MEKENDQYSLPLERKQGNNRSQNSLTMLSGVSKAAIIRPNFGGKKDAKSSLGSHAEDCMACYRIFAEK